METYLLIGTMYIGSTADQRYFEDREESFQSEDDEKAKERAREYNHLMNKKLYKLLGHV
jgi:hypothetical protein